MRTKIIIFLTIFGVLFTAGCAGYGDSDKAAPAAPGEEEAGEIEPADEAGNDEETEMDEEETKTGAEVDEETEEETDAEEPAAEAGAEIIDVELRDFTYILDTLRVEVGQTLRWTNYDTAIHNVVGSGFESDTLQEGDTFTFTFEEEGTYDYICTLHPGMEGMVIVKDR